MIPFRTGFTEVRPALTRPPLAPSMSISISPCDTCCEALYLSGNGAACFPLLYRFVDCDQTCPRTHWVQDTFGSGWSPAIDTLYKWIGLSITGGCASRYQENVRHWILQFDTRSGRVNDGVVNRGVCFLPCGAIPEENPVCGASAPHVPSLAGPVAATGAGTFLGVVASDIWTYDIWSTRWGTGLIGRGLAVWVELAEFDINNVGLGLVGLPLNFRRFAYFGATCEDKEINLCAPEKTITIRSPTDLVLLADETTKLPQFIVPGQAATQSFTVDPLDASLVT